MPEVIRRIRPTPIEGHLGNPHQGCCTFQRFNGDELFPGVHWSEQGPLAFPERAHAGVAPGYLPSTVAYCRWYWQMMEPEEGTYDFSMIERSLETAAKRGQTLAIRLMPYGRDTDPGVPAWYARRYGLDARGQPDHDAPVWLEHFGNLIREAGRKFAGDLRLESVDTVYFGWWGEGDGKIGAEQCRRFAALYREAFPGTLRLGMCGGDQMKAALAEGAGWRHDCFGDLKCPGSEAVLKHLSWNQMYEAYPREIGSGPAVNEAWRRAPVHFETCWVPMHWFRQGYDLDFILQQGLKWHGTYFMPKSSALPAEWLAPLGRFCDRLGYRFVLRHASLQSPARLADGAFRLEAWIDNVGVAPLYHRYELAVRLRQRDRQAVVRVPDTDPRAWLPGDTWLDRAIPLPPGFKPGWIDLALGLCRPSEDVARVKFAVKEAYGDGWASLGGIEVD